MRKQTQKKQVAPAPEPLYDIFATPKNRRIYWGSVAVIYSLGYALSVWGNLNSGTGMPLKQALLRPLTTMLVIIVMTTMLTVIVMQAPVWFWYRKRMKQAPSKKN